MLFIHSSLVTLHIIAGALALPLFWMPAITKKGGRMHVLSGRAYAIAMYVVSISGFVASLMVIGDPLGMRRPDAVLDPEVAELLATRFRMFSLFLLMLSLLVFTSVRHGMAALRERRTPGALTGRLHQWLVGALGVLGLMVGCLGVANSQLLLMIFGAVSVNAAWGMARDIRDAIRGEANLVVAHFSGLIASGIGAYTGFFAFGGARFLSDILPGQWQVLPWILPTVVGTVVIARLSRRFRKPAQPTLASQTCLTHNERRRLL